MRAALASKEKDMKAAHLAEIERIKKALKEENEVQIRNINKIVEQLTDERNISLQNLEKAE